MIRLKDSIGQIWPAAESSIELLKLKHDTQLQSCLFGLVNNLDLALKTGYLISDRVVLTDFLYERILLKKKPEEIDLVQLGVIASGLSSCIELAEAGRLVIIPNPLSWNLETKEFIKAVGESVSLTPDLMSLLTTLSIAKRLHLQPYTIAESKAEYDSITNTYLDLTDTIGRDAGVNAYKAILSGLLAEKIISYTEFSVLLGIPISKYNAIILENKSFYLKFMNRLTEGSSLHSESIVEEFSKNLREDIIKNDTRLLRKVNNLAGNITGVGSSAITVLAAIAPIGVILKIIGSLLGLSSRLSGLIKSNESEDKTIVSVFRALYKES